MFDKTMINMDPAMAAKYLSAFQSISRHKYDISHVFMLLIMTVPVPVADWIRVHSPDCFV